jgi:putative FmdB family regulatory protein
LRPVLIAGKRCFSAERFSWRKLMPTYLYKHKQPTHCRKGKEFEITQKITAEKLDTCPDCGITVVRLINNEGGFTWKGGAPTPKTYH